MLDVHVDEPFIQMISEAETAIRDMKQCIIELVSACARQNVELPWLVEVASLDLTLQTAEITEEDLRDDDPVEDGTEPAQI